MGTKTQLESKWQNMCFTRSSRELCNWAGAIQKRLGLIIVERRLCYWHDCFHLSSVSLNRKSDNKKIEVHLLSISPGAARLISVQGNPGVGLSKKRKLKKRLFCWCPERWELQEGWQTRPCSTPGKIRREGGRIRQHKSHPSKRDGNELCACCVQTPTSGVNLLVCLVSQEGKQQRNNRGHGQIPTIASFVSRLPALSTQVPALFRQFIRRKTRELRGDEGVGEREWGGSGRVKWKEKLQGGGLKTATF